MRSFLDSRFLASDIHVDNVSILNDAFTGHQLIHRGTRRKVYGRGCPCVKNKGQRNELTLAFVLFELHRSAEDEAVVAEPLIPNELWLDWFCCDFPIIWVHHMDKIVGKILVAEHQICVIRVDHQERHCGVQLLSIVTLFWSCSRSCCCCC